MTKKNKQKNKTDKSNKMNPKIKNKWINALMSGKFRQTQGTLREKGNKCVKYCCLGVLTKLYADETGRDFLDVAQEYDMLPVEVIIWAGLNERDPVVKNEKTEKERTTCSALNDIELLSFKEIAKIIKEQL